MCWLLSWKRIKHVVSCLRVSRYLGMSHLVSSGSGGLWATHSSIIAFVALGVFSGIVLSWMCFYPVPCARPCSHAFVAAFGLWCMPRCCWLPRCLCWLLAYIVLRVNLVMLLWAHVAVHWLPRTGGWSSWLFPMLALCPSAGVTDHFQLQVTIVTVVSQVVESHDVVLCISPLCWFRILNLGKWKTLKWKPQYGNRSTETEIRKWDKKPPTVYECAL